MTVLAAEGLTVRRQGRTILDQVSLRLEAGRFIAVIGPNGVGKSLLLACLAGLMTPDDGEVLLDDRPIGAWKDSDLARTRAYLPQNPRCEWPIAVERLVALGLTPALPAFGGLPSHLQAQLDLAMADFDLDRLRGQPATTLSGGELSRAMLARAMVSEPKVLIVDEPTTGLDPRHAIDAARRLKAAATSGRLVVAALHDLTLAGRFADEIVALHEGRVLAAGPAAEVLQSATITRLFGVEATVSQTAQGLLIDLLGGKTI